MDPGGRVFWAPVVALTGLTFFRLPEALLLLRLQDAGVAVTIVPLVWAGLHVVRSASSYPGGWLSDHLGPRSTVAAGGLVFAAVAAALGLTLGPAAAVATFLALGLVAGLTESAERALVARLAPVRTGRGFGLYHALTGAAALPAGLLFGWLYQIGRGTNRAPGERGGDGGGGRRLAHRLTTDSREDIGMRIGSGAALSVAVLAVLLGVTSDGRRAGAGQDRACPDGRSTRSCTTPSAPARRPPTPCSASSGSGSPARLWRIARTAIDGDGDWNSGLVALTRLAELRDRAYADSAARLRDADRAAPRATHSPRTLASRPTT